MKIMVTILGTDKNLKILHTALLVVSSIVSMVSNNLEMFRNKAALCPFLLCMSGLFIEEIVNKENIQGKYLPSMVSSTYSVLKYLSVNPIPSESLQSTKNERLSLVDLFLYGKIDRRSVRALVNHTAKSVRAVFRLFQKSEYLDYAIPVEDHKSEWMKYTNNPIFVSHLESTLKPVISPTPILKSVLQLQTPLPTQIPTFKPAKEEDSKEQREAKKLKMELKKAFRDARRELKKDSQALHEVRSQQVNSD